VHGVEAYLTGAHCVWRCRLRDRSIECIWGTPGAGDEPPKFTDVLPAVPAPSGGR
jgi:hypothetical protein